jgi:hypothetical protein
MSLHFEARGLPELEIIHCRAESGVCAGCSCFFLLRVIPQSERLSERKTHAQALSINTKGKQD